MTLTHSGASELSQLMEGTTAGALIPEIVLTCGSPCLEVLPLSQQSEEVQVQVAEQLTQVSIESLICPG